MKIKVYLYLQFMVKVFQIHGLSKTKSKSKLNHNCQPYNKAIHYHNKIFGMKKTFLYNMK